MVEWAEILHVKKFLFFFHTCKTSKHAKFQPIRKELHMAPKHVWLPKEGLNTMRDDFYDEVGKTLLSYNYHCEFVNKDLFPNLSIPRLNNLGHTSHEKVRKTVKKINGKKIVLKTPHRRPAGNGRSARICGGNQRSQTIYVRQT